MELEVNGKDLKPTESIKEYIEKRLAKLKKYFNDVIKVSVQLKEEGKNKNCIIKYSPYTKIYNHTLHIFYTHYIYLYLFTFLLFFYLFIYL